MNARINYVELCLQKNEEQIPITQQRKACCSFPNIYIMKKYYFIKRYPLDNFWKIESKFLWPQFPCKKNSATIGFSSLYAQMQFTNEPEINTQIEGNFLFYSVEFIWRWGWDKKPYISLRKTGNFIRRYCNWSLLGSWHG